jgi:hypothetical protein
MLKIHAYSSLGGKQENVDARNRVPPASPCGRAALLGGMLGSFSKLAGDLVENVQQTVGLKPSAHNDEADTGSGRREMTMDEALENAGEKIAKGETSDDDKHPDMTMDEAMEFAAKRLSQEKSRLNTSQWSSSSSSSPSSSYEGIAQAGSGEGAKIVRKTGQSGVGQTAQSGHSAGKGDQSVVEKAGKVLDRAREGVLHTLEAAKLGTEGIVRMYVCMYVYMYVCVDCEYCVCMCVGACVHICVRA